MASCALSLEEFVRTSRDAAQQLVANLHRAGELIQSFSRWRWTARMSERRQFGLSEATDQIIASLRPVLKKAAIALSVDVRRPGNRRLSGLLWADPDQSLPQRGKSCFPDGRSGTISISARPRGSDDVEIILPTMGRDDAGRAAAGVHPFFTRAATRRHRARLATLSIICHQQLGGRMMLDSRLDKHHISHYHAAGRQRRLHNRRRNQRRTPQWRPGRCPPPDRRFRSSSRGNRRRRWKVAVIDDDQACTKARDCAE